MSPYSETSCWIYAYVHARTQEVLYVGQSVLPSKRDSQHRNAIRRTKPEPLRKNVKLILLHETTCDRASELEREAILKYRAIGQCRLNKRLPVAGGRSPFGSGIGIACSDGRRFPSVLAAAAALQCSPSMIYTWLRPGCRWKPTNANDEPMDIWKTEPTSRENGKKGGRPKGKPRTKNPTPKTKP